MPTHVGYPPTEIKIKNVFIEYLIFIYWAVYGFN